MEIYKPIKNYENYYQITNKGNILSLRNNILLKFNDRKGYNSVELNVEGIAKRVSVHRLVAIHFIPNPDNLPLVNHIDGNTKNNNVENLEWITPSGNQKHAVKRGYNPIKNLPNNIKGINHGRCKLTEKEVYEILDLKYINKLKIKDIANLKNLKERHITSIINRQTWKHLDYGN